MKDKHLDLLFTYDITLWCLYVKRSYLAKINIGPSKSNFFINISMDMSKCLDSAMKNKYVWEPFE